MGSRQGGQGATIYSVAERAGVSIATVSRVLQGSTVVSDKTRAKVLAAVEELNYVPLGAARSLAVRQHEAVGLVLPELTGPYYAELLLGFETRAAELGQSVLLLLSEGKRDLAHAVRQLATRVDGLADARLRGDPRPGGPRSARLETRRRHRGRRRARRRGRRGRERGKRPGADGPPLRPRPPAPALRRRPRLRPRLPRPLPRLRGSAPSEGPTRGRAGARSCSARRTAPRSPSASWRASSSADALVCANDELALSIMTTLQDGGLAVPDDIAVVGWDDVMTARYIRPALTTVRQPVRELGALVAERLHERVAGRPRREGREVLPTQVVLRSSCGCPGPTTATPRSHAPRPARASSRSLRTLRPEARTPPRPRKENPRPRKRRETGHETNLRHSGRHADDHRPGPVRLRS